MSWVKEDRKKSWIQKICCNILRTGPVPKHVAFIMDGNRRFASKNRIDRSEGHISGFDKLSETLEWCWDLGITEVTVYAFSIENFKRSKEEVDGLMELARQKFARLLQEKDLINKHEVCVRVLGNLSLLPRDIQELVAEVMLLSKDNSRATLNVCFAYTSRDEICRAMRETAEGVQLGLIRDSDIDEDLLSKCLYTSKSEEPELLVRTSGEVRLSDFLLWQTTFSLLSFMQVLWPEFSFWHLCAGVLHYQRHHHTLVTAKDDEKQRTEQQQREQDYLCVLQELEKSKSLGQPTDYASLQTRVLDYSMQRQQRIERFLAYLQAKEDKYLESLLSNYAQLSTPQKSPFVCV